MVRVAQGGHLASFVRPSSDDRWRRPIRVGPLPCLAEAAPDPGSCLAEPTAAWGAFETRQAVVASTGFFIQTCFRRYRLTALPERLEIGTDDE